MPASGSMVTVFSENPINDPLFSPCDVRQPKALESLFNKGRHRLIEIGIGDLKRAPY